MVAGGPPGGFDYNTWAAMNLNKGGSGGGSESGEAMTPEKLIQGGADKVAQTIGKVFGVNPNLEGNGPFKDTNIGGGLSLTNVALIKPESGGGFLSMIWDTMKKYFVRELPQGLTDGIAGDSGGSSGGTAGSGGGDFDSGSGSAAFAVAGGAAGPMGGGDFHGHSSLADFMPEMRSYGGREYAVMDISVAALGTLSPPNTGSHRGEVDAGMSV